MDYRDAKSRNEAYTYRANSTANGDTHASAVDGRKHLAGDDATDDSPAHLHDEIENTGNL